MHTTVNHPPLRQHQLAAAVALALLTLPALVRAADASATAPAAVIATGADAPDATAADMPAAAVVVVTGAKAQTLLQTRPLKSVYGIEASVLDTPRAVSQISAEQLLHDGIKTADDLVKYAPGVTRNGGQNVSVAPLIRGQGSELYQDGQRVFNVRHPFNLNAFEGADIVAGPPPAAFGTSSRSGGYVNYLAKLPDFERQHSQVSGQFGTWVPGGGS